MDKDRKWPRLALAVRWMMLVALCVSMLGCKTIRVSESDFMRPDHRPDAALREGQVIDRSMIETPDGRIAVTRISKPGNKVAVLYCGGNQFRTNVEGGRISAALPASVDVVIFDYPGYGGSSGTPTVEGLMQAAILVYDAHMAGDGASYDRRAVYGVSMGGFMAAHVAAERSPEMLVLEGTAPSVSELMRSLVPWFAKPFVSFEVDSRLSRIDNVSRLADFQGKVLLLVGESDTQTRPSLMRRLRRDLENNGVDADLHVIPGRGHGNTMEHAGAREIVRDFLGEGP